MEYIWLGGSELEVSRVCLGTFPLGGAWGRIDEQRVLDTIRKAYELGINFFDTAQAYGFGKAESLLSRALGPQLRLERGRIVLATKGGLSIGENGLTRDASPGSLRQGLEESLRYLGTDYVDLYQVHWPDPRTPIEETTAALLDFVKEGKVRYLGVSNFDVPQMEAFRSTAPLHTLQPPYSLFVRDIERDILPYCQAQGIGVLVYGPLAHGLLAGSFGPTTTLPSNDWRSRYPGFSGEALRRNLQVVDKLKAAAERRGRSVAQLAIAWTLAHPAVQVAIVGARCPEQVEVTAAAVDCHLGEVDLRELADIASAATRFEEPTPETV